MRMMFAEPPLEALIADAADGRFSAGAVASIFAFACFAVFTTSKIFALRRLAGGGRFALKVSSAVAIACALLTNTYIVPESVRKDPEVYAKTAELCRPLESRILPEPSDFLPGPQVCQPLMCRVTMFENHLRLHFLGIMTSSKRKVLSNSSIIFIS